MVQWLAPASKKVVGLIPGPGAFLCLLVLFVYLPTTAHIQYMHTGSTGGFLSPPVGPVMD